MMEMYADKQARGGVLEPEGIVEIKYRKPALLATMARLDKQYGDLKKHLESAIDVPAEEKAEIKRQLEAREQELLPVYQQIAIQFADLHDRTGRMKAKGVIRKPLEWRHARKYFYWRVRRRLNEEYLIRDIKAATDDGLRREDMMKLVLTWFKADIADGDEDDEQTVAEWLDQYRDQIKQRVAQLKRNALEEKIVEFGLQDNAAVIEGFSKLLKQMAPEDRKKAAEKLSSLF
ncbi:hypothetical protein G6F42_026912 [Rhizopus arrhizus]|nr:hypothetical protein G6F42_026912 [Rhizopus arrhizus]